MKRDLEFGIGAGGAVDARARWLPACAIALTVMGILAVYWPTAASIVAIWIRSETFAHGFVVLPLALWLAWRRHDELATVPIKPWWPGLAVVFASGALWFVASASGAGVVSQFALVFMLQSSIVTVIGLAASRVLGFALAFLLFAVPAGEFLVPTLIDWTADFTVAALRLSGVPVYREANHFVIPSGAWSVVEACSGIRYVIASLMVGTIYAAVAYRSAGRRVLFVAASILVPVIANWLRAYMIVMTGHLSNNKLAVGVDHLVYGWIFFGVVMLLLFWVGSFWQQGAMPAHGRIPVMVTRSGWTSNRSAFLVASLATLAMAVLWYPIEGSVHARLAQGEPELTTIAGTNNWSASREPVTVWKPDYKGFSAQSFQTFANGDARVNLYIAFYRRQGKGHELITSTNVLTEPSDWRWRQTADGVDQVEWDGRATNIARAEVIGQRVRLEVMHLYWIAGRVTSNAYVAKGLQAFSNLMGGGDDAALVILYAPITDSREHAREVLRAFANDMSPAIDRTLQAARASGR